MTERAERPSPHPFLRGRERDMGEMADAVRRLAELTVTSGAPPDVLRDVLGYLATAVGRLEDHVPETVAPRFFRGVPTDSADAGAMHDAMPFDLVMGRYNPLAPPVEITMEPPKATGRARFSKAYEGAEGWVHGAAIAAAFDIVLTAANRLEDAAGPTVRLSLRFRRPTLLDRDSRFESWVEEVRGRRVVSRGVLMQDGVVKVEAEGEFAVLGAGSPGGTSRRRRS